jgi:phage terminase Nu1 subunit (DNA packaging protein)
MISSEELAEWLDVPVGTLDQWASRGGGPVFHKIGLHRRYEPADVKKWLRERRLAATGDPRPAEPAERTQSADRRPAVRRPRKAVRRRGDARGADDSNPAA